MKTLFAVFAATLITLTTVSLGMIYLHEHRSFLYLGTHLSWDRSHYPSPSPTGRAVVVGMTPLDNFGWGYVDLQWNNDSANYWRCPLITLQTAMLLGDLKIDCDETVDN